MTDKQRPDEPRLTDEEQRIFKEELAKVEREEARTEEKSRDELR